MNLLQLKYFCHVAQTGSVTKSARALFISQPALSRAITALERELGTPLFDRSGRGIALNASGSLYYQQIAPALEAIDRASRQLSAHHPQPAGLLRLNLLTTPPRFAELIEAFAADCPEIRVQAAKTPDLTPPFDLAFLSGSAPVPEQMQACAVYREEVVAAVYPSHPWAERTEITVEALTDQPLILPRPSKYSFYHFFRTLFADHGITPHVVAWSDNSFTTKTLMESGAGISLFTRSLIDSVYKHTLHILPFQEPLYEELLLIWPNAKPLSAQARRFLEFCRRFYQPEAR